jgi:NAD(P)-dependent dehydrogenase (short-subunit alcohol dehydrogenase family)
VKVLLLGGTGVFGARLARLLVRDGHGVTIAARNNRRARRLADELGCNAIQMDRSGALDALEGHDVVVDAAGPFHSYGEGGDPYRLARAALAAGAHYLDLSDNAGFCAGIATLDDAARARGLCARSGLSSVLALSSAAVRALAGREVPQVIDCAILPGNRAPRGLSVMASILAQAGRPMRVWRGGAWQETRGWSDPKTYELPDGLTRQGWQIDVPDLTLFPGHFGAQTVLFRAGLELGLMRYGLAGFALLRRRLPFAVTPWLVKLFKLAADLLAPFGSGRGGMSMMVQTGTERRFWRLLAEDGDGPFIPAIAVRALLRRDVLPVGAGPALEAISLEEAEAAMSDLKVRTERVTTPVLPIFAQVLGEAFDALPPEIRATHQTADISRWEGEASVTRGHGLWGRFLGRVFGFPAPDPRVPVCVIKTATDKGETWQRRFGKTVFRSHLAATGQGMTERFGPFRFLLALHVREGHLSYPVTAGWLGPLPLPRWLLPVSQAREYVQKGRFRFDVELRAPVTGELIVRYKGALQESSASRT